uniref:Testis-specific Y-encoded protein 1-like n=1 Tax=Capra hircus TaxID=9925 RepID=A0A452FYG0_CAPHI
MSCPLASDPGWGHGQSEREHERRSEECGSILGPQTSLVVSLVVTPGEDATLFRVEAGEDGEAQVDGVVAGIRWGFQLLAEDIFEDVEVVPDEEQQQGSSPELEEKTVEEPGGPSELPALDVLQALATLQGDLSSEPEKTCRAYVWFTCKSHERRKRDLAQKSAIIQGIPGFWANVVSFLMWHKWLLDLRKIMNHPQASVMISDQDKDFLTGTGASHPRSCSKLIFSFRDHPYFLKRVIIKEYYLDITGKNEGHHSTPVHWFWDFEQGAPAAGWRSRNCPESDRIAEIISKDEWDDPLKDYPRREDTS